MGNIQVMKENIRVHELAKEFGLSSSEFIIILKEEGIDVSSHLSVIEPDDAELVRSHMQDRAGGAKVAAPSGDDVADPASSGSTDEDAPASAVVDKPVAKGSKKGAKAIRDVRKAGSKELHLKPPIVVKELAADLDLKPNQLIHDLLKMNVFAAINQTLDTAVAAKICKKYGYTLVAEKREKQAGSQGVRDEIAPEEVVYDNEEVSKRPPVVAFLGHVDHGKTSLLDRIRNTNHTASEAGGITQHIGASSIEWKKETITFIDTPGHEAFTAMRARGAMTTDIVVLVVAADDGVMPQTVEAINHAKAAEVPIIVAMNKIDLEGTDPLRVQTQLQENNITPEDWGGDVAIVPVSAKTGAGMDDLLERILLEAELLELKANPKLPVKAIVLESQLEQGLGATVNVLVKNGTIKVGEMVICGRHYGKVKVLIDHLGKRIKSAGPSHAAKVVGLSGVSECGALLVGCKDEKQAKKLTAERETEAREKQLQPRRHVNLEDLFRQIEEESRKELKVIVKTDVQGTGEAVSDILKKLESPKIRLEIIHNGVGSISENDVLLASASDAVIVGFHVRVNPGVNAVAKKEGVDIRLYSIIYELAEQIKDAMVGMLEPELREEPLGKAEIIQIFTMSKGGKICGCSVSKGIVRASAKARVYRGDELIYNGVIQSLRRFQDDVKEVRQGFECGIRLDHFNDFETGDIIDVYEYREMAATL